MNFIPLEYEVLSGLRSSRFPALHQPRDTPGRVITLLTGGLDRLKRESKPVLKHQEGFFFEDKTHDWHRDYLGRFRYFSRTICPEVVGDEKADVLVVYQWMEQTLAAAWNEKTIFHGITAGSRYQITLKRDDVQVAGATTTPWVLTPSSLTLHKSAHHSRRIIQDYQKLFEYATNEMNTLNEADKIMEATDPEKYDKNGVDRDGLDEDNMPRQEHEEMLEQPKQ